MKLTAMLALCTLMGFLAWNGNVFLAFFCLFLILDFSPADWK